jgi:hypothetical protein
MRTAFKLVLVLSPLAMAVACGSQASPTAPSGAASSSVAASGTTAKSGASLVGTWSSQRIGAASTVQLSACSNIQMQITDQSDTTASGTFSMMCPEDVHVSGVVSGQLGESVIPLTWAGTATQEGFDDCAFSVTGTGELLAPDVFHLAFSGSDCHGPVDGSDDLRLTFQPS